MPTPLASFTLPAAVSLGLVACGSAAGVDVPVLMPLPWGGDRTQVIADTLRAAAQA